MGEKRGRYATKQQEAIHQFMCDQTGHSLTVDQISDLLKLEGISVGKTTVYRALERMTSDGEIIQVPDWQGGPCRYCFLSSHKACMTYLACMKCHKVQSLGCGGLSSFINHLSKKHQFMIEPQRTILFGYCAECGQGVPPCDLERTCHCGDE